MSLSLTDSPIDFYSEIVSITTDKPTYAGFTGERHSGHVTFEERQPKKWDTRMETWIPPRPEHWSVTLSPLVSNGAWRYVIVPTSRCADMATAVRLAMRLLPPEDITIRNGIFGGMYTVKRNALIQEW